ncbi:DUF167 domain-containing protein [Candidatus Falkowbacteria bacterium]|nr:DUF167 domain-containing protein [Candidatus Falkowbacteria bacterium]
MTKDILVRVITRSSITEITEEKGSYLKIKLKAAPVKGKANSELIKLLAKKYKVAKSQVEIIKGLTSNEKLVRIFL